MSSTHQTNYAVTANVLLLLISNAITLCGTCASKHIKLGYNISYIRDMNNEWDNYLLTYILLGGVHVFKISVLNITFTICL